MDQSSRVGFGTFVSRVDIEALLAAIAARTPDRDAGIFGPQSVSWRINRESALFLGAGRAALLQLAHPWVVAALADHSTVMNDPIRRFHNTFRIVFTMVFGTLDQALAAARHLHALHTTIRGVMPEDVARWKRGSHYEANEIAALRWVFATLVESAVLAHDCVLPPLTSAEREQYYARVEDAGRALRTSRRVAARKLGGIRRLQPRDARPSDETGRERRGARHGAQSARRSWLVASPATLVSRPDHGVDARAIPPRICVAHSARAEQQLAARAKRRLPGIYRTPAAGNPLHRAMARSTGSARWKARERAHSLEQSLLDWRIAAAVRKGPRSPLAARI